MLDEMIWWNKIFFIYIRKLKDAFNIFSFHAILLINPNECPGLCVNNQ